MTGCPSRARDEELLLAKISEAAGRQRLGRRRLTYPGVSGGTHRTANCLVLLKIWCAGVVVVCVAAAVVCAMRGVALAAVVAAVLAVISLGVLAFALRAPGVMRDRNARLDLYEHGLTVAVDGRIHAVRYDATTVVRDGVDYTLTDVDGERIVLRGGAERGEIRSRGEFRDAQEWGPEIHRAVAR